MAETKFIEGLIHHITQEQKMLSVLKLGQPVWRRDQTMTRINWVSGFPDEFKCWMNSFFSTYSTPYYGWVLNCSDQELFSLYAVWEETGYMIEYEKKNT